MIPNNKIYVPFLILCFICVGREMSAQKYNTAIGLRFGNAWGMTIQQRILDKTSLELMATKSLLKDYTKVNLMAERHFNVLGRRFNLYLGGGLYSGFWKPENGESWHTEMGLSGIAGIELTISRLVFSYDVVPTVPLFNAYKPIQLETALSLRYMLFKKKWKPFKKKR